MIPGFFFLRSFPLLIFCQTHHQRLPWLVACSTTTCQQHHARLSVTALQERSVESEAGMLLVHVLCCGWDYPLIPFVRAQLPPQIHYFHATGRASRVPHALDDVPARVAAIVDRHLGIGAHD